MNFILDVLAAAIGFSTFNLAVRIFHILRTETNTKLMQKNPEMDVAMISAKYHNGGFSVKKRTIGVIAVANAVKKAIIAV